MGSLLTEKADFSKLMLTIPSYSYHFRLNSIYTLILRHIICNWCDWSKKVWVIWTHI